MTFRNKLLNPRNALTWLAAILPFLLGVVIACADSPNCVQDRSCVGEPAAAGGERSGEGGAPSAGARPDDGGHPEAGSAGETTGGSGGTGGGSSGAAGASGGEGGASADPCETMPCERGTCVADGEDFSCECEPEFTGDRCELPRFEPLGFLPGFDGAFGSTLSRDGRVVLGYAEDAESSINLPFRWTHDEGNQLFGPPDVTVQGTNADASVVVGSAAYGSTGSTERAFRWSMATGFVDLGVLTGGDMNSSSVAAAVSADGAVVVGESSIVGESSVVGGTVAFRWTTVSGMVSLGLPAGAAANARSQALGTSADGRVVVGGVSEGTTITRYPFRWTSSSGMQRLGTAVGGSAQATNAEGSVVVGYAEFSGVTQAFRWTESTGIVPLGMPSECSATGGWDVSDDGRVVAVICEGGLPQAFVWNDTDDMRRVADVLQEFDALPPGWMLSYAWRVSGDGRTILGVGVNPQGATEPWIARL